MRLRGLLYSVFALGVFTSQASFAVEYYRYTDERGITVINRQGVPPHLIGKGYEVLSEQGRVIRVVPRAPTPEEYRQMQADKERAKSDRQLLMLYTRIEDIDRARDRKVADIDGQISIARGNLLSVNSLRSDLQAQAASQERAGRTVSASLLKQIEDASIDQQRLQQQISRYLNSKKAIESAFARDKNRLAELLQKN
ncbi:DUF4124 domain-containing protein [Denitrificimonas caeni]|uniref:DUF4124 domain-containing protein n=1 Tax=Denitrificimonas caeni TaxID=521720 RepID=A0AAE9VNM6_9GAMM|nr:DUF4124 domain-containing protein [Denitrificimonas caeni]WBE25478.1 DUF4124 domain-containing protein [Denitrificimonas caeni]